jgi:(2R)-sulfolactate sulfo-lyase subunit alpha
MTVHFIMHEPGDSCGVVVVEGVHKGDILTGWVMSSDGTITLEAKSDIPIGHKLATTAIPRDGTVIKYGVDIGRAIAPIGPGEHLHVHNVKTKRW